MVFRVVNLLLVLLERRLGRRCGQGGGRGRGQVQLGDGQVESRGRLAFWMKGYAGPPPAVAQLSPLGGKGYCGRVCGCELAGGVPAWRANLCWPTMLAPSKDR